MSTEIKDLPEDYRNRLKELTSTCYSKKHQLDLLEDMLKSGLDYERALQCTIKLNEVTVELSAAMIVLQNHSNMCAKILAETIT